MIRLRHPRFLRSLGLALMAGVLASCSGAGGLNAGRIASTLTEPAAVTRAESGDTQASSTHTGPGRRVRLGLGAGSVW
jgi:hypothetical protein